MHSKKVVISIILAGLVGLASAIIMLALKGPTSPLSADITSQVNFPIYYPNPKKIPPGYSYVKDSAHIQHSTLFFQIKNQDKTILFSEQSSPATTLGLSSLVGFEAFEAPIGTVYAGQQKTGPTALIQTPKILISITGSADVSQDVVSTIAKALAPLK